MDVGSRDASSDAAASPAIDAELARFDGACWAIDPLRAVLVSANAPGYARLGLEPRAGVPLDPALPAIRVLRQIASDVAPGRSRIETLVLATPRGEETLTCDVWRPGADARVLMVAPNDLSRPGAVLSDPERQVGSDAATGAAAVESPRRSRNDAETLAEIARRIRETQAAMRRASEAAMTSTGATLPKPGSAPAGQREPEPPAERPSREARLAHELRTPLSAIVAAAEIMRDERFGPLGDERYRGYASDIFDSARHALEVINGMLGARAQAAGDAEVRTLPELRFAEIDLNTIAESAVSSLQPLAAAAALELSLQLATRLPRVVADAVSIRQIVLNLLTNALKFTGPGGRIRVTTAYRPDGPLTLSVADNGRGMKQAEIASALGQDAVAMHAPQPNAAARAPGSLGIGLAVVRTLARANGAAVSIDSTVGQGTIVSIAFGRDRIIPV